MIDDLKGYTAFITGGSSGLGYEMAKHLVLQGACVIIGARSKEKLLESKKSLEKIGEIHTVQLDVTDEDSVKKASSYVLSNFNQLDMLINNAGIGRNAPGMEDIVEGASFLEIPVSSARAVIETNMLGPFIVSKYFVPIMLRQGFGSIVYVSTSNASMTRAGGFPYGPSKAGGQAFTNLMMRELEDTGIRVNIITPGGFVDTTMAGIGVVEKRRNSGKPVLEATVLNQVISFLASEKAKSINGEIIVGTKFEEWLESKNLRNTQ